MQLSTAIHYDFGHGCPRPRRMDRAHSGFSSGSSRPGPMTVKRGVRTARRMRGLHDRLQCLNDRPCFFVLIACDVCSTRVKSSGFTFCATGIEFDCVFVIAVVQFFALGLPAVIKPMLLQNERFPLVPVPTVSYWPLSDFVQSIIWIHTGFKTGGCRQEMRSGEAWANVVVSSAFQERKWEQAGRGGCKSAPARALGEMKWRWNEIFVALISFQQ